MAGTGAVVWITGVGRKEMNAEPTTECVLRGVRSRERGGLTAYVRPTTATEDCWFFFVLCTCHCLLLLLWPCCRHFPLGILHSVVPFILAFTVYTTNVCAFPAGQGHTETALLETSRSFRIDQTQAVARRWLEVE